MKDAVGRDAAGLGAENGGNVGGCRAVRAVATDEREGGGGGGGGGGDAALERSGVVARPGSAADSSARSGSGVPEGGIDADSARVRALAVSAAASEGRDGVRPCVGEEVLDARGAEVTEAPSRRTAGEEYEKAIAAIRWRSLEACRRARSREDEVDASSVDEAAQRRSTAAANAPSGSRCRAAHAPASAGTGAARAGDGTDAVGVGEAAAACEATVSFHRSRSSASCAARAVSCRSWSSSWSTCRWRPRPYSVVVSRAATSCSLSFTCCVSAAERVSLRARRSVAR